MEGPLLPNHSKGVSGTKRKVLRSVCPSRLTGSQVEQLDVCGDRLVLADVDGSSVRDTSVVGFPLRHSRSDRVTEEIASPSVRVDSTHRDPRDCGGPEPSCPKSLVVWSGFSPRIVDCPTSRVPGSSLGCPIQGG